MSDSVNIQACKVRKVSSKCKARTVTECQTRTSFYRADGAFELYTGRVEQGDKHLHADKVACHDAGSEVRRRAARECRFSLGRR